MGTIMLDNAGLAVGCVASKGGGRYALSNVLVDVDGATVASDGAALMAVSPVDVGGDAAPEQTLVSADARKVLAKAARKADVELARDNGTARYAWTIKGESGSYQEDVPDGMFPAWREVIPERAPEASRVLLDPAYLAKLGAAFVKMGCKAVELSHESPTAPVLLRGTFDGTRHAVAVVMPIQTDVDTVAPGEPCPWERGTTPTDD